MHIKRRKISSLFAAVLIALNGYAYTDKIPYCNIFFFFHTLFNLRVSEAKRREMNFGGCGWKNSNLLPTDSEIIS